MIIDAHMHIWNRLHGKIGRDMQVRAVCDGVVEVGDTQMLGMPAYMHDCNARAEYFVAEMDAAGVDLGVVVQENMDGEQNDYCLEVLQRYPDRFWVHALPNYWELDNVEKEAMALFERGFRGLKLPAGHLAGQIELDDPRLMPIFRVMDKNQFVLAVDLSEGEDQVPAMRRILETLPTLRVAIGHFGMPNRRGWPGQLDLCQFEHVYLETGGIVWLYRAEGDPFPNAVKVIRQAADKVGMQKLMWGSDWPRTMVDFTYRQSVQFLRESDQFSEEDRSWLLGRSAATLYQLGWTENKRQVAPLITDS